MNALEQYETDLGLAMLAQSRKEGNQPTQWAKFGIKPKPGDFTPTSRAIYKATKKPMTSKQIVDAVGAVMPTVYRLLPKMLAKGQMQIVGHVKSKDGGADLKLWQAVDGFDA